MSAEISFFHLFLEASILVQLVMLTLLAFSVVCWAMIFQRRKVLRAAANQLKTFEDKFWSGADLSKLYREVSAKFNILVIGSLLVSTL